MKVLHSDQGLFDGGPSIFLAGPTPRDSNTLSWRLEALRILESLKFDGTVLVPERQNWSSLIDYADQIDWELDSLTKASVIAFWVPRNMAIGTVGRITITKKKFKDVHDRHCCKIHGCKYNDEKCTVVSGICEGIECERCDFDKNS